jgi:hypothetical protein
VIVVIIMVVGVVVVMVVGAVLGAGCVLRPAGLVGVMGVGVRVRVVVAHPDPFWSITVSK